MLTLELHAAKDPAPDSLPQYWDLNAGVSQQGAGHRTPKPCTPSPQVPKPWAACRSTGQWAGASVRRSLGKTSYTPKCSGNYPRPAPPPFARSGRTPTSLLPKTYRAHELEFPFRPLSWPTPRPAPPPAHRPWCG